MLGLPFVQTTLVKFLEQLSGWVQDESHCPPPAMVKRIFLMAKDNLLGSTVVLKMVRRDVYADPSMGGGGGG
jgi:hypothetical protein